MEKEFATFYQVIRIDAAERFSRDTHFYLLMIRCDTGSYQTERHWPFLKYADTDVITFQEVLCDVKSGRTGADDCDMQTTTRK